MANVRTLVILVAVVLVSAPMSAAGKSGQTSEKWLDLGDALAANTPDKTVVTAETSTETTVAKASKAPPIPFHTIDGYGGAAFTPIAYLVNPGPKGTIVGLPSASYTFVRLGSKHLQAVSITQTFFRRIELGYAMNRLGLGSFDDDIEQRLGVDINRDEVWLHHFNIRVLLIEENSFGLPLPAIVAGIHFKYNDTIDKIDDRLGGALRGLGYQSDCGQDYTITASKMFPKLALGRPVVLTGGLRFSKAAQMGYLGYGSECNVTFEGNVTYLPVDWLALVYEFRQKKNPYDKIDKIVGVEDNWQALSAHWIVNEHMTVTGAWICAGNIANSHADGGWAIQVKWEF